MMVDETALVDGWCIRAIGKIGRDVRPKVTADELLPAIYFADLREQADLRDDAGQMVCNGDRTASLTLRRT